ncbi:MAG: DUF342 domain-containing protein, partial [Phycisphaerales bacterium]|nr:DUF342 domain-containing protein [Phycisphaerales bacterium]
MTREPPTPDGPPAPDAPAGPDTPGAEPAVTVEGEGALARLRLPAGSAVDVDLDTLTELARAVQVAVDDAVLAALRSALDEALATPADIDRVIAEASPPVDGRDGWLEWERGCEPCPAGSMCNVPDAQMRVDHYNRIAYIRVTGGEPVATLHPPTAGEDGRDVRGRVERATPGRPCAIQLGAGLGLKGGRVVPELDGVLELANNRLSVSRHFDVPG